MSQQVSRRVWQVALSVVVVSLMAVGVAAAEEPTVTVTAPTAAQGDFWTVVDGNVRDMNSVGGSGDVQFNQPTSGSRIDFSVVSDVPDGYGSVVRGEVSSESDDLVTTIYYNSSGEIPTTQYRYFIYRTQIAFEQPSYSTNGRLIWLPDAFNFAGIRSSRAYNFSSQSSPDRCNAGEWCVFFFDLSEDITAPGSPSGWDWGQSNGEAFGLFAHERWVDTASGQTLNGNSPDFFYLDFAYLTGDIVTTEPQAGSTYTVQWSIADQDGGTLTSRLYYQGHNEMLPSAPTCDGTTINQWTEISGGVDTFVPATVNRALPPLVQATTTPFVLQRDWLIQPRQVLTPYAYLPLVLKSPQPEPTPTPPVVTGPVSANRSYTWSLADGATYTEGNVYYVCVGVTDNTNATTYQAGSAPVIKVPALTNRILGSE